MREGRAEKKKETKKEIEGYKCVERKKGETWKRYSKKYKRGRSKGKFCFQMGAGRRVN